MSTGNAASDSVLGAAAGTRSPWRWPERFRTGGLCGKGSTGRAHRGGGMPKGDLRVPGYRVRDERTLDGRLQLLTAVVACTNSPKQQGSRRGPADRHRRHHHRFPLAEAG